MGQSKLPITVITFAVLATIVIGCVGPSPATTPIPTPEVALGIGTLKAGTEFSPVGGTIYPKISVPLTLGNMSNKDLTLCSTDYCLFLNGNYFGGCVAFFTEDEKIVFNMLEDLVTTAQFIKNIRETCEKGGITPSNLTTCDGPNVPSYASASFLEEVIFCSNDLTLMRPVVEALRGQEVSLNWDIYIVCDVKMGEKCYRIPFHSTQGGISGEK